MPDDANDGKTAFLPVRAPAPATKKEPPRFPDTMPEVPLDQAVAPGKGPPRMAIPLQAARQAAAAISGELPALSRNRLGSDDESSTGGPKFQRGGHVDTSDTPADFPPLAARRENLTPEHPGRYVLRKEFGRGGQ